MKQYRHLFFDLDRTLWDFETNAREAFQDIYIKYGLNYRGIGSLEDFIESYHRHNKELWDLYRDGKIEKKYLAVRRFEVTLLGFGVDDPELSGKIGIDYITISPKKTNLFPHALEALEYLKGRYQLHIITNGFEEVQFDKLKNSGLERYFDQIITSEAAGCKKPDNCIFIFALEKAGAKAEESLMIGDEMDVDIIGAQGVGIDTVLFNPGRMVHKGSVQYEITDPIELIDLL